VLNWLSTGTTLPLPYNVLDYYSEISGNFHIAMAYRESIPDLVAQAV
jgi:hypothetical protein